MADRPRKRVLLAYGLAVAVCGSIVLWLALPKAADWPLMGYKLESLEISRAVIEDGGAVLLQPTGLEGEEGPDYSLVGSGDDRGIFVVIPPLTDLAGISDVRDGLKLLFILLFFPALLLYPLIFNRLLDSRWAGFAAPLLLLAVLLVAPLPVDVYWLLAWPPLALLPLVLLVDRRTDWRGRGFPILVGCAVAASFASAMRSHAGLAVLVAAVIVVLTHRQWGLNRRIPAVVALVAAYLTISPVGMNLIQSASESWADDHGGVSETGERSHVFWHSLYIGLGYLPNDEGIVYLDQFAKRAVAQEDPDIPYLGPGYESAARELYLDTIASDPANFLSLTVKKAIVAVGRSALVLVPLGIALALLQLTARFRRPARRWALLLLPALLFGLAQGLLVMPYDTYLLGWSSTLTLLLLLAIGAALALAESSLPRRSAAVALRTSIATRVNPRIALGLSVCLAAVMAAAFFGSRLTAQSLAWQLSAPARTRLDLPVLLSHSAAQADEQTAFRLDAKGPGGSLPRAAELDGISALVVARYSPFDNEAAQTFEGWSRRSDNATADTLFGGTSRTIAPFLRLAAGSEDVQFFSANGVVATWEGAWPSAGDWVHWALVFDAPAGTAEFFINGKSAGVVPQEQPYADAPGVFMTGARASTGVDNFAGSFAAVAVFPRALAPEAIQSHFRSLTGNYRRAVLGDDPSLYWEPAEARGIRVLDGSGQGHHGTFAWDD